MMLTEREISNWIKRHNGAVPVCRFCGKPTSYQDSDYVLTKRKDLIAFHIRCYIKKYHLHGGKQDGQ